MQARYTLGPDRMRDMINGMIRGGGGNDHIMGTDNDDSLSGGPGNDLLEGGRGNDMLLGYAGNDTLNSGSGDDELDFNRLMLPPSQRRVRFPGDSADPQSDIIAGNDNLNGGDGEDTVGARFLTTPITATNRTLIATNSNDLVNSVETFQLGQSDDTFSGPIAGRVTRVFGNEGNDRIDVTGNGHPAHGDSVDCGEGQDRVEIDFPRPGAEHVSHDPDIADGTSECESSNYLDFLNAAGARR